MSRSIEIVRDRVLCHIVQTEDGNYYYVDSCDTWDRGYETMAFKCSKTRIVKSWREVYCRHYDTAEDMIEGHAYAVNHLEELINA